MSVARKRAKVKRKQAARGKRPRKKTVSVDTKKRAKRKKKAKKPRPIVSKPTPQLRRNERKPDKKRSKAAKKGWQTRRANALRAAAATDVEAHIAFLRLPQVSAQITEQLIRTGLIRPGMVQSTETQMLSRLIVAEQLGNFDETAYELADEYDWDVREVYTLWHSP